MTRPFLFTGGIADHEVVQLWTRAASDPGNDGIALQLDCGGILDGTRQDFFDTVMALLPADKSVRLSITNTPPPAGASDVLTLNLTHQDKAPVPVQIVNLFGPDGAGRVDDFVTAHDRVIDWLGTRLGQFTGFALGGLWTRGEGAELDVPCWNRAPYDSDNATLTATLLAAGYNDDDFVAMNQRVAGAIAGYCAGGILSSCVLDPMTFGIGVADGSLARRVMQAQADAVSGQCRLAALYESLIPGRPAPAIYSELAAITGGLAAQMHVGSISDATVLDGGYAYVEDHLSIWRSGP